MVTFMQEVQTAEVNRNVFSCCQKAIIQTNVCSKWKQKCYVLTVIRKQFQYVQNLHDDVAEKVHYQVDEHNSKQIGCKVFRDHNQSIGRTAKQIVIIRIKCTLQSNPLNITSLYFCIMSHSTLFHRILYPQPAPTEYNQATLWLISLRTMSQIG